MLLAVACAGRAVVKETAAIEPPPATSTAQNNRGTLTLTMDGVPRGFEVVALPNTPASIVNVSGSTLELGHGPGPQPAPGLERSQGTRLWLANDGSLSADSYVKFSLRASCLPLVLTLQSLP
eukprot:7386401-Prymnesium_polylepis.1